MKTSNPQTEVEGSSDGRYKETEGRYSRLKNSLSRKRDRQALYHGEMLDRTVGHAISRV